MEKEEATKILENQFKLLAVASNTCEPECLDDITKAMLDIYTTLFPYQDFQGFDK